MAVALTRARQANQPLTHQNGGILSLDKLTEGESGLILESPSDTMLASLGFRKGKKVTVTARGIMQGPLVCTVDGRNVALGQDIARDIVIEC